MEITRTAIEIMEDMIKQIPDAIRFQQSMFPITIRIGKGLHDDLLKEVQQQLPNIKRVTTYRGYEIKVVE